MALQCACSTDPFVLSSNNYIVGQVYWFVLDGCAGDVCDYSIQVLSGSTVPMLPDTPGAITGDTAVCGGTTSSYEVPLVNGATQYVWTLSPPGTGIITQGTGNHIDVKWSDTGGDAELCLRTGNACVSNSESVCQTIHIAPKPSAFMGSGGNICLGLDSTFELSITLTGAGPWAFTPLLDGVPQPPIVTSDHPYSYSVSQPGKYTISELYETQQLCPGTTFGSAVVSIDTIKSFTFEFCPGESVTVFGHTYTQPGIIRDPLFEPATCSTVIDLHFVHLPQPTRTKTIPF